MSRGIAVAGALVGLTLAAIFMAAGTRSQAQPFDPAAGSLARDEPQLVYSPDANDPWNRLFYMLFTRTVQARVLPDDVGPASLEDLMRLSGPGVTRIEDGDRAIDPFYGSWTWMGSPTIDMSSGFINRSLEAEQVEALLAEIRAVRATGHMRPPLARALMQADLWAAHDRLSDVRPGLRREAAAAERVERLIDALSRAIHALALSKSEIDSLPDNYAVARRQSGLPNLFDPSSGWVEVRWLPIRMHERAVHDRRAARIFIKPRLPPRDVDAFINRLRYDRDAANNELSEVALIVQGLLIANDGAVVPSPLTHDVQIRQIEGRLLGQAAPRVSQHELSRQLLLVHPTTGGLVTHGERAPAYLPFGGSDLSFATPIGAMTDSPILAPLHQRCVACHGPGARALLSFLMTTPPAIRIPDVSRFNPTANTHAREVAARKMQRPDFAGLKRVFKSSRASR